MEFHHSRELSLRETPGRSGASVSVRSPRPEGAESARHARVLCSECRALITFASERVSIGGAHEHDFTNPSGLRFRVGCFASAPGAAGVGETSDVWTWFPGYAWQSVLCRGCIGHVGWSFTRGASVFFALILDRLHEE